MAGMSYEWIISTGISIALELRGFITRYLEVTKSKDQLLNAICDEITLIENSWERLYSFSDEMNDLLDSIGIYPDANQMYHFLQLCAEAFRINSQFTNAYVSYSKRLKYLSVNDLLMGNLKKYKGLYYEYVNRVSETVTDDDKIIIDGRFTTFLKAYRDEILPSLNQYEEKVIQENAEQFIKDINAKIVPSLSKRKPRSVFRQKRLENIFLEPIKQYLDDKDKIIFNVPKEDMMQVISSTSMPIFYVLDEISKLEVKIRSHSTLPRGIRRRRLVKK